MDNMPNDYQNNTDSDGKAGESGLTGTMQQQIDTLREEIARLTTRLSDGAAIAKETATGWYEGAADQARDVSEVARAYPVAVSSTFLVGSLLGLLVGMALSRSSRGDHWYDTRWR